jgi:photosystem II biogenesis protein Psp29
LSEIVNNVRTVSDTKRAFYTFHTRPINSIYRRVVEELMVEMHLLSVNADFHYDPVYALGVVTAFDRFMQGYRPEQDKPSIFEALCRSIEDDPQRYRQSAEQLRHQAGHLSLSTLLERAQQIDSDIEGDDILFNSLRAIAHNESFKYSRLFAIGLYSLVELVDAQATSDTQACNDTLQTLSDALKLPATKLQKDLELYRSNLEKISQAQEVMKDVLAAEKKRKEQREAEMAKPQATEVEPSDSSSTPSTES